MAISASEDDIKFVKTPKDFKECVTQKFLGRGKKSAEVVADETGVTVKTLYNWVDRHAKVPVMKKHRTTFAKMKLVIEFNALSEEDRGEFLRRNGLFESDIERWQKAVVDGEIEKVTEGISRKIAEQKDKEIAELKKELHRKEKALAEAAALLVLKKKVHARWGEGEE